MLRCTESSFLASTWYGLYAPAGIPPEVIETMRGAYMKALADTAFTDALRKQGIDVLPNDQVGPAALRDFTAGEHKKWERVIREAGITPQS